VRWTAIHGDEDGDGDIDGGEEPGTVPRPVVRNTGWGARTVREGARIVVRPAIRVSCPAAATRCALDVVARARGATIAHARSTLQPGTRTVVSFVLNAKGRRLLRASRRISATVAVTVQASGGDPVALTKKVPIRRPPVAHSRRLVKSENPSKSGASGH
jgi:hypothetical protein